MCKIFDARTLDILPYSHRFLPNLSSLAVAEEGRDSFLVSDVAGTCSLFSLANGLVETQQCAVVMGPRVDGS